MYVYRIERKKYLVDVLSGKGVALCSGNRWNSLHTPMVYTSQSRSLAVLEILARVNAMELVPSDRLLVELEIPDRIRIEEIQPGELPPNWNIFPPGEQTQMLGDAFIRKAKAAVCKVPSSLLEGEFNYLINPMHADSKHIRCIKDISLNMRRWLTFSSAN
jgi:RES domain-containing protein